jgi:hypothetical protein
MPRFSFRLWAQKHMPAARRAGTLLSACFVAHCTSYSCWPFSFGKQRRLTGRSSGRANGVPPGPELRYGVHFLFSGPGGTPSSPPLAPTLGSTLRQCRLQASQFECSFRQPLPQYRSWRLTVVFTKIVATPNTCPASGAALTSFGVRGWRHRPAQDSEAQPLFMLWARLFAKGQTRCISSHVSPMVSGSALALCWQAARFALLWLSGLLAKSRVVSRFRRAQSWLQQVASFPYSRAMQARNAALPNPSVKRSANIASRWPSSAGAAPHFALAAQRATLLATAYLKR